MHHLPRNSLDAGTERRARTRLPVSVKTEALEIGGARLPVHVKNVSLQGAMFDAEYSWKVGKRVWLFFPSGLIVNTKIAWANGGRHGCEFLHPLGEGEMLLATFSGSICF